MKKLCGEPVRDALRAIGLTLVELLMVVSIIGILGVWPRRMSRCMSRRRAWSPHTATRQPSKGGV